MENILLIHRDQFFNSQPPPTPAGELIGQSPAMQNLRQLIRKVARTDAVILVQGEPGAGKSAVARELHRQSARADKPLFTVPCAQADPALMQAQLFGQTASPDDGYVHSATGATLLLEEIAELPSATQARLLEFLQQGSSNDGAANGRASVRFLATTSRDLEREAREGRYNEQLFYRLNIMPVAVPPLRERRDDVPSLVEFFRQQAARKYGSEVVAISPEAIRVLQEYSWPGNVRELRYVIDRAIWSAANASVLEAEHLLLQRPTPTELSTAASATLEPLHEVEKKHIFAMLTQCRQNRTHAARLLGISIRTLRNKLREYRQQDAAPDQPQTVTADSVN